MGILCNKWQLDGSHKPCCRNTSCPAGTSRGLLSPARESRFSCICHRSSPCLEMIENQ